MFETMNLRTHGSMHFVETTKIGVLSTQLFPSKITHPVSFNTTMLNYAIEVNWDWIFGIQHMEWFIHREIFMWLVGSLHNIQDMCSFCIINITPFDLTDVFYHIKCLWKENLNSDFQQCHQYQQNDQSHSVYFFIYFIIIFLVILFLRGAIVVVVVW